MSTRNFLRGLALGVRGLRASFYTEDTFHIFDDYFPDLRTAFRVAEYNQYLSLLPHCEVHSAVPSFDARISEYRQQYPALARRVKRFDDRRRYWGRRGYTVFLNNASAFLPTLERYRLPFVFTLYPGGGFWLENPVSDDKLRRVCESKYLKAVISTQKITTEYLVQNGFVDKDLVRFIYGGVFDSSVFNAEVIRKRSYPRDKAHVDICFVAYKYMPGGKDKGFDQFVRAAVILSRENKQLRFHVVGDFSTSDLADLDSGGAIRFYGPQLQQFFREFYAGMDMIVSPNVPFCLYPGGFDGFPTGACIEAGLSGVLVVCTDPLNLNSAFVDRRDLVIIHAEEKNIVSVVRHFSTNVDEMYSIARSGQEIFQQEFNMESQISRRLDALELAGSS